MKLTLLVALILAGGHKFEVRGLKPSIEYLRSAARFAERYCGGVDKVIDPILLDCNAKGCYMTIKCKKERGDI